MDGQTVGVSCGAGADDYRFTETADGVYTYSGSGGDAIFPLDGTKFSIYLKGDALKVYDTMAYPTDAQDGPYQKTIDYYTITYSTGDATGGTLPDNDIEKIGTLYAVSYEKSLTKEGYQQVGWSKSPSGTVVHHILVSGKTTLYPVWAAKTGVSSGRPRQNADIQPHRRRRYRPLRAAVSGRHCRYGSPSPETKDDPISSTLSPLYGQQQRRRCRFFFTQIRLSLFVYF